MKRISLLAVVAAGLLIPSAVFVAQAGAANPHGPKSDPTASCGGNGGGKPSGACSDRPLPQSEGCLHGQAPAQNPHCTPSSSTGTNTSTPAAPGSTPGQVAGESGSSDPNQPAGTAAQGGSAAGEKLAFTGSETLWLALLGGLMLASGLALRARAGDSS